jgi:hypothetical protein
LLAGAGRRDTSFPRNVSDEFNIQPLVEKWGAYRSLATLSVPTAKAIHYIDDK